MSGTSLNNKTCFHFSTSTQQLEEEVSSNKMKNQGIISIFKSQDFGPKPVRGDCNKVVENNQKQDDVWGSIISQKKSEVELPPPYVHPLLRKSNSTLSEKSLELCTENLGSETGSDGFSSYPPSEAGCEALDFEKEEESGQENIKNYSEEELVVVPKYNHLASVGKKMMQPRSFPPPLSSLTHSSNEGSYVHMHSQRVNGRLVLQAVAVPSAKNFQAQRLDGRLRLTLFNTAPDDEEQGEQLQVLDEGVVFDQKGDKLVEEDLEEMCEIFKEEEEEEEEDDVEIDDNNDEEEKEMCRGDEANVKKQDQMPKLRSESINVHRSAFMTKKLIGTENHNQTWSHKLKYKPWVELEAILNEEITLLPQSLPPRPRTTRLVSIASPAANEVTTLMLPQSLPPRPRATGLMPATPAAATINSYEYFWRAKSATGSPKKQLTRHSSPFRNNITNGLTAAANNPQKRESVVLRNCQETRSLLSWEPYCIATS